ncbi:MAG: NAD(P)H-hydrate epimerase [Bacteroidota bacterium]
MPKVLTAKQIREWDSYTIQNEPIASIDLMERACRAFVEWFVSRYDATNQIGIVCGTGNNGGDGLGIARMLHQWNYHVKVWIVRGSVPETTSRQTGREYLLDLTASKLRQRPIAVCLSTAMC